MGKKEMNVLVVEDNPSDVRLLHENIREFKTMECKTKVAASMKDVLNMLEQNSFDAIFLDLNLPDSKGLETVKKINDKRKDTPVIVMSGTSEQEVILKALKMGVRDYIIKGQETPACLERAILYSIEHEKNLGEIKKAVQKYSALFNSSPVGTMVTRFSDGKILECNAALGRQFGYTCEEMTGKTTIELGLWESAELRKKTIEKASSGNDAAGIEVVLWGKTGGQVTCLYSAAVVEIEGETCVVSTVVDVSKQRETEGKLLESEEKFRSAFEQAAVGMTFTSVDGSFIDVNRRFCEITGYAKEELVKMKFAKIADPDQVEKAVSSIQDMIEGKLNVFISEQRDIRKDGSRIWINLRVSLVRNADNSPKYFMAVYEDVSGRKAAEQALINSEEKWASFSESVEDLLQLYGPDLRLVAVNSAAKKAYECITGKEMKEGATLLETLENLGDTSRYEKYVEVIKTGKSFLIREYPINVKDSEPRYFSLKAFKAGEGMGLIITDITEIKRSEIILKQSYEKLKEVDRLKSNFISIISHELRTPLTIIKGFASFLIKEAAGQLNENQKNFVNTIQINTARLARVINDMVDLSKIETGNFSVEKEKRELIGIINEAVDGMRHIVEKNGLVIETVIEVKDAHSEVDKGRIIQTIMNLINNAMRFTGKGGTIKVGLKSADKADVPDWVSVKMNEERIYYFLYVSDNGGGIEKKYLEKIFERFYQVENANVRKHQGAGLGLSIAKNIVETHDGFIWAESDGPGKGTKICFLLPG